MKTVYKRILLKISGEVLAGEAGHGIDFDTALGICKAVKEISRAGVQVGLVVGGGNFWRGRSSGKMDRSRADHMGMLATVMNATALEDTFEQIGVDAVAMSALPMEQFAETFVCSKAKKYLEEGKVVILVAVQVTPSSQLTQVQLSRLLKSKQIFSSRQQMLTVFTIKTPISLKML